MPAVYKDEELVDVDFLPSKSTTQRKKSKFLPKVYISPTIPEKSLQKLEQLVDELDKSCPQPTRSKIKAPVQKERSRKNRRERKDLEAESAQPPLEKKRSHKSSGLALCSCQENWPVNSISRFSQYRSWRVRRCNISFVISMRYQNWSILKDVVSQHWHNNPILWSSSQRSHSTAHPQLVSTPLCWRSRQWSDHDGWLADQRIWGPNPLPLVELKDDLFSSHADEVTTQFMKKPWDSKDGFADITSASLKKHS